MTRRDIRWRVGGVALFVAACGTSLMHRSVSASVAGQPASSLELLLGLLSFMLASAGMLLIIQGERLPASWRGELDRRRGDRIRTRHRPVVRRHADRQHPSR